MRYCTKCGNELAEKASLCDGCGCAVKKQVQLRRIGKFPACFILLAVVLLINIAMVVQCAVSMPSLDEKMEDLSHFAFNGFDTEDYELPSYMKSYSEMELMDADFNKALNAQSSQSGSINAEGSTAVLGGLATYTVTVKTEDIAKYEAKYEKFVEEFSDLTQEAHYLQEGVCMGLVFSALVVLLAGFVVIYEKKMMTGGAPE